ncbi:MAG TPA: hypothetical protein VN300_14090 [Desulfobacterales bacterium]|nr:hypothetical protein [Desulfobacterales bacterium]
MLNLQKIKIEYCMDQLSKAYERNYSKIEQELGNIIVWSTHLALENIANSDALYHNVEHTVMAALAGQAVLEGRHLSEGGVMPRDWAHFIIALLFHDIGYVKGICKADRGYVVATGSGQETVEMPRGSTDAALAPYHVERSKMFVRERFGQGVIMKGLIDVEVITAYIEMTRFPFPEEAWYQDTLGYRGLVRASDFIGQLGDPNRLQKCTALFYEFEEIGLNAKLGYKRPGDLRTDNTKFYWDVVSPYVQEALRYLRVTQDGKQWIANLQANVFGHGIMADTSPQSMPYPR